MTIRMKILIAFLAAAAVLNGVADLWFRLGITMASAAPWYVWAPVVLTAVLVAGTLAGGYVVRRRSQRALPPEAPQERSAVVFQSDERSGPSAHDVRLALDALHKAAGDGWTREDFICGTPILRDGRWEHAVYFARKVELAPGIETIS